MHPLQIHNRADLFPVFPNKECDQEAERTGEADGTETVGVERLQTEDIGQAQDGAEGMVSVVPVIPVTETEELAAGAVRLQVHRSTGRMQLGQAFVPPPPQFSW